MVRPAAGRLRATTKVKEPKVDQVRYGIIGCGMMGQEHMRNIALLPEARVAAYYEPDDDMAGIAAAIAPDATRAATLAELLAVEELDCLLIVSPNFCHIAQMEEIAAMRPLPLLVEKPLFTDPKDAKALSAFRDTYPGAGLGRDGIPVHACNCRVSVKGRSGHRRHQAIEHTRTPVSVSPEDRELE